MLGYVFHFFFWPEGRDFLESWYKPKQNHNVLLYTVFFVQVITSKLVSSRHASGALLF